MSIKHEAPTVTDASGPGRERATRERHPAYAQISASRVSSGRGEFLYGSDFAHHAYVMVRIAPSDLTRDLSHDWPHASLDTYIEVALSEAQWATFVSTLNTGDGPQCTLQRLGREAIPQLPAPPTDRRSQFRDEIASTLAEADGFATQIAERVAAAKMTEKARDEIIGLVHRLRNHLTPGAAFVSDAFGEHVERVTEHAKIEVNAYLQHVLVRAGIDALSGDVRPISLVDSASFVAAKQIEDADDSHRTVGSRDADADG